MDHTSSSQLKSTTSTKAIPMTILTIEAQTCPRFYTRQTMALLGALLEAIKGGAQGFVQREEDLTFFHLHD
jgi:hypothetical protein